MDSSVVGVHEFCLEDTGRWFVLYGDYRRAVEQGIIGIQCGDHVSVDVILGYKVLSGVYKGVYKNKTGFKVVEVRDKRSNQTSTTHLLYTKDKVVLDELLKIVDELDLVMRSKWLRLDKRDFREVVMFYKSAKWRRTIEEVESFIASETDRVIRGYVRRKIPFALKYLDYDITHADGKAGYKFIDIFRRPVFQINPTSGLKPEVSFKKKGKFLLLENPDIKNNNEGNRFYFSVYKDRLTAVRTTHYNRFTETNEDDERTEYLLHWLQTVPVDWTDSTDWADWYDYELIESYRKTRLPSLIGTSWMYAPILFVKLLSRGRCTAIFSNVPTYSDPESSENKLKCNWKQTGKYTVQITTGNRKCEYTITDSALVGHSEYTCASLDRDRN